MNSLFEDVLENLPAYYDKLILATQALDKTTLEYESAKGNYEAAKLAGLANGTIDGKNETLREANARQVFSDLHEAILVTETAMNACKTNHALMRLQVEKWSKMLRLAEIESRTFDADVE